MKQNDHIQESQASYQTQEGVDITLLEEMKKKTYSERLQWLQDVVDAQLALQAKVKKNS
ncbi:MAG: hypothetical protein MK193_00960 [Lentisphaeria bacterium]|nr:hypothetical protein [Lentisphaeria bacterium]